MNYSRLLNIFSLTALAFNLLEKILSYFGQTLPLEGVHEGNWLAKPVMNFLGIPLGHVVMVVAAIAEIWFLRWVGVHTPSILKDCPRQRQLVMGIVLFCLGYLSLNAFVTAYRNACILWKSLI